MKRIQFVAIYSSSCLYRLIGPGDIRSSLLAQTSPTNPTPTMRDVTILPFLGIPDSLRRILGQSDIVGFWPIRRLLSIYNCLNLQSACKKINELSRTGTNKIQNEKDLHKGHFARS